MKLYLTREMKWDLVIFLFGLLAIFSIGVVALPYVEMTTHPF